MCRGSTRDIPAPAAWPAACTAVLLSLLCAGGMALAGGASPVGVEAAAAPHGFGVERHSPPAGSPFLGPAGAPLTLVVFFDYQCPVCPRAAAELERLVSDLGGKVRVSLRHHPLAMHRQAMDAALAASAAQRQGKFWEYHDRLLAAKGGFSPQAFERLAVDLGLDIGEFRRDLGDPTLKQPIVADSQAAEALDAAGTPAFLLNGQVEVGWASYERLRSLVAAEWEQIRPAIEREGRPPAEVTRLRVEQADRDRAPIILDLLQR